MNIFIFKYLYIFSLSVLPSMSLRGGPCSTHLFTHLCQSAYPGRGEICLQCARRDCHLRGLARKKRPAKCKTNNSCTMHMDRYTVGSSKNIKEILWLNIPYSQLNCIDCLHLRNDDWTKKRIQINSGGKKEKVYNVGTQHCCVLNVLLSFILWTPRKHT